MRHVIGWTALGAALLLAAVGPSHAQRAPRDTPGPRAARPVTTSPQGTPEDTLQELRGTVQSVDRQTRALRVAPQAPDGRDTMLQLIDATEVRVEGRAGSLADLQDGALIRASYQDRYGINVARVIDVLGRPARTR